jgi:PKD repeat protein
MKTSVKFLCVALATMLPYLCIAQQGIIAVKDSICIQAGQTINYNVISNDHIPAGFAPKVVLITPSTCFGLTPDGHLFSLPDAQNCCGINHLRYRYENCDQPPNICAADIIIKVVCPKPDCFNINLENYTGPSSNPTGNGQPDCAYACEHAHSTYYVPFDPTSTYTWSVLGGTFVAGANPAEINVTWGGSGSGTVSLTIVNSHGETTVIDLCVHILPGPVAAFMASSVHVCLGNPISFMNNSTGGSTYFWDFGDGITSPMFSPHHTFGAPGTYKVCLTVTKNNFDAQGKPLCCCTDSVCTNIIVDDLPGPSIFCISTLCSKDSSKYWTDAPNCGSYIWTVLDANGNPHPFIGQGNDTICVHWGNGPMGTITLQVLNCATAYCNMPVSVTVPIIPPTAVINGLTKVCQNATATYSVPKWLSALYAWQVTGGTIISGQGTNTIQVQWGPGPGPGMIHLQYNSSFLGGLPGENPADCMGLADLTVLIKPEFDILGPSTVCQNTSSGYAATPAPSPTFTWTITPAVSFTGQGSSGINVNWNVPPGVYVIKAVPTDTTAYCIGMVSKTVRVESIPKPTGISGPVQICPGETDIYQAQSNQPGVGFIWTVTGGTPAFYSGNPLTVVWNASGPYSIALKQYELGAPGCMSDTILLHLIPKVINGPLTISGPPGCINSIEGYVAGPVQNPSATYQWTVSPAGIGSVASGQGTPNVSIQWNNTGGTATLSLTVSLCNSTLSKTISVTVHAPVVPVITQTGILCPGVQATLDAGAGFTAYQWSTGATTQTTLISAGGLYHVTTTDLNGCTAVGSYTAVAFPGPTAFITTPDPTTLCINPPNTNVVNLLSLANNNYTFQWYCNGVLQALPPGQSSFVHHNTNVAGTFAYHVVVTDANGCSNTSNTIVVTQVVCTGGGNNGCNPQPYTLSFTSTNQVPNCNVVDFAVSASGNVTLTGWNFGDPLSNVNSGTLANAVHAYATVGCTKVYVSGTVPEQAPGTGNCAVSFLGNACVPLVADFTFSVNCQTVTFTDGSTYLPGHKPKMWMWSFGDASSSTVQNPVHTYVTGGTYPVTLTVTDSTGCQATITKNVVVANPPNPVISYSPNPPCAGQPVQFTGSGPGITTWLWAFGDGSTNGSQTPVHTYLSAGNYNITLTGQDAAGCSRTIMQSITVYPALPPDTISYAPSLKVCAGTSVVLTAPAGPGYTWLWSTGATSQSISVMLAGTYSVTVTDAHGCTLVPKPVKLIVLPIPPAYITGPHVICDQGCITLHAPAGFGLMYSWLDQSNNPLSPPQTGITLMVCDTNLMPAYSVSVTDANGCTDVSPLYPVSLAVSPSFSINISHTACEGAPVTLTVTPIQPHVVYAWSTGATGPSIVVQAAGVYTAVGTDTLTGCQGTAQAVIHPLPDLCLVPAGCYKTCNPDTICGPAGLAGYQWNMNGQPIAGATNQCLIVHQSGTYTLTGTTAFGCSLTSDSLMLTVMNCGCSQLSVSSTPSGTDSCCWALSYSNQYGDLLGLTIHTPNAGLNFNLGTLNPALSVYSITANSITLVNAVPNTPLPGGTLTNFIAFCMQNVQQSPEEVFFDWYDLDFHLVCTDSLQFDCPVEPDCLYVQSDTIYCDHGRVQFTMTVCNPADNDFSVGFIQIFPTSPTGLVITPMVINTMGNPIPPGGCRTFNLVLSGPNLEGKQFCFYLTAHDNVPEQIDTTICCSLDTVYCVTIPDCYPCDNIGVSQAEPVGTPDNGVCCYQIALNNTYSANLFDGITLCMLTPGTSLTLNNPFGSGWTTTGYTPTVIQLGVAPPLGTHIPLGTVQLPVLCVHTNHAPPQMLEIKWVQNDSILCRDTVPLTCEPPCGYILNDTILCDPATGGWVFQGMIKNTSAYTMALANFVFTSSAGLNAYNQSIPLGNLPPGGTYPFSIVLGAPAQTGDTVCFTVALHTVNDNNLHLHCCNFNDCIVLPNCNITEACVCNPSFPSSVALGIYHSPIHPPDYSAMFSPIGPLLACDKVEWTWSDSPVTNESTGMTAVYHKFQGPGQVNICISVSRNSGSCVSNVCRNLVVLPQHTLYGDITVFPNPTHGPFVVGVEPSWSGPLVLRLLDVHGRLVTTRQFGEDEYADLISVDPGYLPGGFYMLEVEAGGQKWIGKVIVQ